jgi:hypothetical protein
MINSSKGNRFLYDSIKDEIGDKVIGDNIIGMIAVKPYEGGLEIRQTNKFDANGSVPYFIQNYAARNFSNFILQIADYYQYGKEFKVLVQTDSRKE